MPYFVLLCRVVASPLALGKQVAAAVLPQCLANSVHCRHTRSTVHRADRRGLHHTSYSRDREAGRRSLSALAPQTGSPISRVKSAFVD